MIMCNGECKTKETNILLKEYDKVYSTKNNMQKFLLGISMQFY